MWVNTLKLREAVAFEWVNQLSRHLTRTYFKAFIDSLQSTELQKMSKYKNYKTIKIIKSVKTT